jgi:hypothetical protein
MSVALGTTRIVIGLLILMTGILKFTVPRLRAAWSGNFVWLGCHSTGSRTGYFRLPN